MRPLYFIDETNNYTELAMQVRTIDDVERSEIVGFECFHAVYAKHKFNSKDDALIVKERAHLKDGSTIPNVRIIENYQRDFYITKKAFRNHEQKKEYEDIAKLEKRRCTQRQMPLAITKALEKNSQNLDMRAVGESQYLYGTDISSSSLIRSDYRKKWPGLNAKNTVAIFDLETDTIRGHEKVVSAAVTFNGYVWVGFTDEFAAGEKDTIIRKTIEIANTELAEEFKLLNVNEVLVTEHSNDLTLLESMFERIHMLNPDILSGWNLTFDLKKILECFDDYGVYPEDYFSHPSVPVPYRQFSYSEPKTLKVMASGKTLSLHPADTWVNVRCSAGFYIIDAMRLYKGIRVTEGNMPNYKLDTILKHNKLGGKLKFDGEGDVPDGGLKWHQHMQRNLKPEYMVYNIYDCMGIEMLDRKNKDMSQVLSLLSGDTDLSNFKSTPKRLCDDLHWFCLERNLVMGCTGKDMKEDLDEVVVGLDGWVVTLPCQTTIDAGLKIIKEFPELRTKISLHTYDLDVSAAYPTTGYVLNCSKETTLCEIFRIKGISDYDRKTIGLNMVAGNVNAVQLSNQLFKLPQLDESLDSYIEDNSIAYSDIPVDQKMLDERLLESQYR